MSVIQKNFYSNSDVSIIDLMNTADSTFKGKHQVSLTNYDNTSLPAIAIGSIVENNGSLFEFTSETAISGSPSDGSVYIYLVPSGDPSLGTATVTPTFTNTSPTWSDSKQGWYGTGGSANYRYIGGVTKLNTSWTFKFILVDMNGIGLMLYRDTFSLAALENLSFKNITIEDLRMYAIGNVELLSWTSTYPGTSSVINIHKPCMVYYSRDGTPVAGKRTYLYPGTYRFNKDASAYETFQVLSGTLYENVISTFTGANQAVCRIMCTYAEGMNTLDASKIVY